MSPIPRRRGTKGGPRVCSEKPKNGYPIYSLEETKKLLTLIDAKAPTDYKLFFNLLAFSGMRRGEALGLESLFDTS